PFMGQPSLPHVTSRNQTASSARPANSARRSTFQPATTEAGTFAGPWTAKIELGGAPPRPDVGAAQRRRGIYSVFSRRGLMVCDRRRRDAVPREAKGAERLDPRLVA